MRFHAPYMEWAKKRPSARFDLAGINVSSCSIDDLAGARDVIDGSGSIATEQLATLGAHLGFCLLPARKEPHFMAKRLHCLMDKC